MTFHPLMRTVAAGALISLLAAAPAKAEEVTLKAVTAFPKAIELAQSFQRFVAKVNEAGKGVVQIDYLGGPEVIPPPQQAQAVRRGVVDMQYGPGTYYLSEMPEVDAWVGSTVSAEVGREKGGFEILQEVYKQGLGAYLLAHADSGVDFHIYLTEEPKRTPDGGVDLSGIKLRSQPIYREFFEALGATAVSVPVPEVYTSLERGVVDGLGWPLVGIKDLSWDEFLKYRIDPGFFATDLAIILNQEKWDSLSQEAKDILTKAALEHEKESYAHYQQVIKDTDKEVRADGMQVIELTGDARQEYLDMAFSTAWKRLKDSGSAYYDQLRAAYYDR